MSRRKEPEGTPQAERNPAQELEWSTKRSLDVARSWCNAIDRLEQEGKLEYARTPIVSACETIARMSTSEDERYCARRALERLDALGMGPDQKFSRHWRARLAATPDKATHGWAEI